MIVNKIPKACRNLPGIYIIKSTKSDKVYIGSAVNLSKRFRQHLHLLRKGVHRSSSLQQHFNGNDKYTLSFNLLERCEETELLSREQYYLDLHNPFDDRGFNTVVLAGTTKGYKHTEEAKRKMSMKKKGIKMSEEVREMRRKAWTGRKHSPEAIENMRKAQANKSYGPEARKNMSLAHLGHKQTEQTKAKRAASLKGNGHNKTGIILLNVETGIFYHNIKAAAQSTGTISHYALGRRMSGKIANTTPFVAV